MRGLRTFGPAVERGKDGQLHAVCTWCIFRARRACTYARVTVGRRSERPLPDGDNTPDWCELKADMLRDAEEMAGKEGR